MGLGSNLGNREQNLLEALRRLRTKVAVVAVSSPYDTEPLDYQDQPPFINAVCQIATSLSPQELLACVKEIEGAMGRQPSVPKGPRLIDIDILFYDNIEMESESLTLPHAAAAERAFVLAPLAEVAPHLLHPGRQRTVMQLLAEVSGKQRIAKREWPTP